MSPTTASSPKLIQLTYSSNDDKVHSEPPSPLRFEVGEYIAFQSDQGPVSVELHPANAYEPSSYHTGSDPVKVLKKEAGKFWCVVFQKNGPAEPNTHTGYPKNKRYGVDVRP